MMWTATVLLWITALFGGQGIEPSQRYPDPKPIRVSLEFVDEEGCRTMIRELAAHRMRYTVLQDCAPK